MGSTKTNASSLAAKLANHEMQAQLIKPINAIPTLLTCFIRDCLPARPSVLAPKMNVAKYARPPTAVLMVTVMFLAVNWSGNS